MDHRNKGAEPSALMREALVKSKLFARASPDLVDRLVRLSSLRRYVRGEQIPTGTGASRQILLIISGVLEIGQITSTGRRFVMGLVGAGEVVGLVRLFDEPRVNYGYTARGDVTVMHLPCSELMDLLDADPLSWKDLAKVALHRKADMIGDVLEQVVLGDAERRIAATLRRLGALFGVESDQGTRLRLRLSQDDLADMLCLSRQTVNKELRHLESIGVLHCAYNTITILDGQALKGLVNDIA